MDQFTHTQKLGHSPVAKHFHKPTTKDIKAQEAINSVFSISILGDLNFLVLAFVVASAWMGIEFGESGMRSYFSENINLQIVYVFGLLLFPIVWMLVNLFKVQVPFQISIGIAIAFFLYACVFTAGVMPLMLAFGNLFTYFTVSICCMYLALVLI